MHAKNSLIPKKIPFSKADFYKPTHIWFKLIRTLKSTVDLAVRFLGLFATWRKFGPNYCRSFTLSEIVWGKRKTPTAWELIKIPFFRSNFLNSLFYREIRSNISEPRMNFSEIIGFRHFRGFKANGLTRGCQPSGFWSVHFWSFFSNWISESLF